MDVPSWHPANADAERLRVALGGQPQPPQQQQRTEYKVMAGSMPDTSTDAGRELLGELTRGADGGSAAVEGRGFFDTSDRLYLMEQRRLEAERERQQRSREETELQKFRSTALKIQAQKAHAGAVASLLDAAGPAVATTGTAPTSGEKRPGPVPAIRVRPKKRPTTAVRASPSTGASNGSPRRKRPKLVAPARDAELTEHTDHTKAVGGTATGATAGTTPTTTTTTTVTTSQLSLGLEYASSSDDSDGDSTTDSIK